MQPAELTQQPGNPAHALRQRYHELMAIQDPEQLAQEAFNTVRPLVGRGCSEQNWKKFQLNLKQASQRGLVGLQSFISNYMLKADKLGVIPSRGLQAESKIQALASLITEDVSDPYRLNPNQRQLKALVESYGFTVVLLEDDVDEFGRPIQKMWGDRSGGPVRHGKYTITHNPKPIPADMSPDYDWSHDDYDGPEDKRAGYSRSIADAIRDIDEIEAEQAANKRPPRPGRTSFESYSHNMHSIEWEFEDDSYKSPIANMVGEGDFPTLYFDVSYSVEKPEPRTWEYPGSPGGIADMNITCTGVSDGVNQIPLTPEQKNDLGGWFESYLQTDRREAERLNEACLEAASAPDEPSDDDYDRFRDMYR